jgi:hypothetical protein
VHGLLRAHSGCRNPLKPYGTDMGAGEGPAGTGRDSRVQISRCGRGPIAAWATWLHLTGHRRALDASKPGQSGAGKRNSTTDFISFFSRAFAVSLPSTLHLLPLPSLVRTPSACSPELIHSPSRSLTLLLTSDYYYFVPTKKYD